MTLRRLVLVVVVCYIGLVPFLYNFTTGGSSSGELSEVETKPAVRRPLERGGRWTKDRKRLRAEEEARARERGGAPRNDVQPVPSEPSEPFLESPPTADERRFTIDPKSPLGARFGKDNEVSLIQDIVAGGQLDILGVKAGSRVQAVGGRAVDRVSDLKRFLREEGTSSRLQLIFDPPTNDVPGDLTVRKLPKETPQQESRSQPRSPAETSDRQQSQKPSQQPHQSQLPKLGTAPLWTLQCATSAAEERNRTLASFVESRVRLSCSRSQKGGRRACSIHLRGLGQSNEQGSEEISQKRPSSCQAADQDTDQDTDQGKIFEECLWWHCSEVRLPGLRP